MNCSKIFKNQKEVNLMFRHFDQEERQPDDSRHWDNQISFGEKVCT